MTIEDSVNNQFGKFRQFITVSAMTSFLYAMSSVLPGMASPAEAAAKIKSGKETNTEQYELNSQGVSISGKVSDKILENGIDGSMIIMQGPDTLDVAAIGSKGNYLTDQLFLTTGISDNKPTSLPDGYKLHDNFPNPFNPETTIRYENPVPSEVTIIVYNALGQQVDVPVDNKYMPAGTHDAHFDASGLASNVYFYRIFFKNSKGVFSKTKKMAVIKDSPEPQDVPYTQDDFEFQMPGDGSEIPQAYMEDDDGWKEINVKRKDNFKPRRGMKEVYTSASSDEPVKDNYAPAETLNTADLRFIVMPTDTANYAKKDTVITIEMMQNLFLDFELTQKNYAPFVSDGSVEISQGDSASIRLSELVNDIEGDSLTYSATSEITDLLAQVFGDSLTIKSINGFNGNAAITYTAYDGAKESNGKIHVKVNPMATVEGELKNILTGQTTKGYVIIGSDTTLTDANGYFSKLIAPTDSVDINAKGTEGDSTFARSRRIATNSYSVIKLTPHSNQPDVDNNLFYDLNEECNFSEGGVFYRGLKTILQNPDRMYWIASHFDDGARASAEEQAYIKSLIENEINPHLKTPISVYVENPDSTETIPLREYGKVVIIPRKTAGFYFARGDENKDGIVDYGTILFPEGGWNETWKSSILEELMSPLIGPNGSNNPELAHKTVLQNSGGIKPVDKIMIKMCEEYAPKTQINDILGKK